MNKIIIILIASLVILVGCTTNTYKDINPQEFNELISDEEVFVIDVHIPEQEHIKGTDAVIPYNEISSYLDKLPKDKKTNIAVYCRSGSMSAQASQMLIDLGYKNVFNLEGGRNAYVAEFN